MTTFVSRMGRNVKADEAFFAWTSGDLNRMIAARSVRTNPIDRHHLLMNIVKLTYKQRTDPRHREMLQEVAFQHLKEVPSILPALKKDLGVTPRIPTYAHLSTVLAEDGRIDEAIAVCEEAIRLGLHDGTKGDYAGRIERLRKKKGKP